MFKPKFKVGEYQIIMQDTPYYSHKTVLTTKMIRGLMSKNFGVNYKTPDQPVYTITHLPTERQIVSFPYLADAKKFITQAEAVPDIDNMHLDNSISFAPTLKKIIQNIRKKP